MLTIDKNKTSIHSDNFDEVQSLKPKHLVIIESSGTSGWYRLEDAIGDETGWIIPMRLVNEAGEAEARKTGSIRDFVVREDGSLA